MADIVLKNLKGQETICAGVSSILFNTPSGEKVEFVENKSNYVIGQPVTFTLERSKWNGTRYTLNVTEYGEISEIQLGLPLDSSVQNSKEVVKSALYIPSFTNKYSSSVYSSTDIIISAVNTPTLDVQIAIWGLIK